MKSSVNSHIINWKELDPNGSDMKVGDMINSFSILHVNQAVGVPFKSCYLRGNTQNLGTLTSGFKGKGVK